MPIRAEEKLEHRYVMNLRPVSIPNYSQIVGQNRQNPANSLFLKFLTAETVTTHEVNQSEKKIRRRSKKKGVAS